MKMSIQAPLITAPILPPLVIPAFAGMTSGGSGDGESTATEGAERKMNGPL